MEENNGLNPASSDAVKPNEQGGEGLSDNMSEGRPRIRRRIGHAEKVEHGSSNYTNGEGYARPDDSQPAYRGSYSQRPYERSPRPYGSYNYGERRENSWGGGNYRSDSRYNEEQPQYSRREIYNNPNSDRAGSTASAGSYQPRSTYQRANSQYGRRQQGNYQRPVNPAYGNQPDRFNRVDADFQRGGYNQGSYNRQQPRYGNYNQGGYDRGGYNQNNYGQGGYQQREGGYDRRQGGFQPRPRGYQRGPVRQNRGPRQNGYGQQRSYMPKKVLRYKEENVDLTKPIRLNKFMANAGICSRREADKYIEEGLVTVNGQVVTELGTKVLRTDEVKFRDQLVTLEDKIYVLLNKPKDYVTTSDDPQNRKTVMDLVKNACPERIYPIGRLDRNTTGVLLLTNDGDLASKLMHPKFLKKKIYHVFLNKPVTATDMKQIIDGIELEDGLMKADAVEYASDVDKKQVGIEIHSGKNRIVRRIFEHLGYKVVKLDRVYFAGLTKKNLRRGEWRFLTEEEVRMLRMGAFE